MTSNKYWLAGVLSLLGSAYFGLKASSSWSDFKAQCDPARCPTSGRPLYDDTTSSARLSTIFFAAGGAAIAAGVVLFVIAPSSAPPSAAVRWSPYGSHDGGGVKVDGRF